MGNSEQEARERELLGLARGGDNEALATVLTSYQARIFTLVRRMVGRKDEAVELTQETFLQAFRSLERYDSARPFRPWLYQIAVNLCRKHLARAARRERLDEPKDAADALWREASLDPAHAAERQAERAQLEAAMARLTQRDRSLLQLRYVEDLPYDELRVVLGTPVTVLKMRVHRALRRLRELMPEGRR